MSAASATVLVPVKGFDDAKVRLESVLDANARVSLAREMATHVVRTAAPLPVAVVCGDAGVRSWAEALDAEVIWREEAGLNDAVEAGIDHLASSGVRRAIIAHSDLPLARDLQWCAAFPGATLVPDRRDDGTNVLAIPTDAGFSFGYGPGSFRRHVDEARRCGLGVRIERVPSLGWDVDVPGDLAYSTMTAAGPQARPTGR